MDSRPYPLPPRRESFATAAFYSEATRVSVTIPEAGDRDKDKSKVERGEIDGFSQNSRKRMMLLVNSLRRSADLPLFVTLTYPAIWPAEPEVWKEHLHCFAAWLLTAYPAASYVWKLEPQQRGAPHFHLLVWGVRFLPWQRIAVRWAEIVSGVYLTRKTWAGASAADFTEFCEAVARGPHAGLVDHLRAGTQVRSVESRNGVKLYASKQYMGKDVPGFRGVGRFWGVHNKRELPMAKPNRMHPPRAHAVVLARIARKYMERRGGYAPRASRSFDLFTEHPEEWERLFGEIMRGRVGLLERAELLEESQARERAGHQAARSFARIAGTVPSETKGADRNIQLETYIKATKLRT